MSFLKHHLAEYEQYNICDIKSTSVCKQHFEDYAISEFITDNAIPGKCSYCGKKTKIVSFEILLKFIMERIMITYQNADEWMQYETKEGGYLMNTYSAEELINDLVQLEIDSDKLRDDIISCIEPISWSSENEYFDTESDILSYRWQYFKNVVKHQSRFVFAQTTLFEYGNYDKKNVYEILKDVAAQAIELELISTIPAGTNFYRCRQHAREEKITGAHQICSPPDDKAIQSNRMSPSGISMFYGAFDRKTAFEETVDKKNKKSEVLTTACFTNKSNLLVVDFCKLPKLPSIFDDKKRHLIEPILFLKSFVKDLSGKVYRDGKEHIEYAPTQIMTEFFRYIFRCRRRGVNGIIYPSSKAEGNVFVLFMNHKECLKSLDFKAELIKTKDLYLK